MSIEVALDPGTLYDVDSIPESLLNYILASDDADADNDYHIIVGMAQLPEYAIWAEEYADNYLATIYSDYVIFAECYAKKFDGVELTQNENTHCCLGWEGGHCFGPSEGEFKQWAYDEENWAKFEVMIDTETVDETITQYDETTSVIVEGINRAWIEDETVPTNLWRGGKAQLQIGVEDDQLNYPDRRFDLDEGSNKIQGGFKNDAGQVLAYVEEFTLVNGAMAAQAAAALTIAVIAGSAF